jgi:DME family drug/metabolite transporter
MIELKNEKIAIPVVLLAGLIWSFGPLVVRYMDQPNLVPWQYIFARGLTIFIRII